MEEKVYETVCDICDTESRLTVLGTDEAPVYCPMCGSVTEWEETED